MPGRLSRRADRAPAGGVLIVARSGGLLARAAAAAGYRSHVVDFFGDHDTVAAARDVRVVAALPGWRFDPPEVLAAVNAILAEHGALPLVWGAGFEYQPSLLCALERRMTIAGCHSRTLFEIADPRTLGGVLDALAIPHPASITTRARRPRRMLVKTMGEAGGAHVRPADGTRHCGQREYFQDRVDGTSMSVAFIADGEGIQVLGFVEHLALQFDPSQPFRHGGGVVSRSLDPVVAGRVAGYARDLAARLKLRGLCGVDFILRPGGKPSVLEVNARPTATFALLAPAGPAFAAHMAACLDGRRLYSRSWRDARAAATVYATQNVRVPPGIAWPPWVADRPRIGSVLTRGDPLCSIMAAGTTPNAARALLERRFVRLQGLLPGGFEPRPRATGGAQVQSRGRSK